MIRDCSQLPRIVGFAVLLITSAGLPSGQTESGYLPGLVCAQAQIEITPKRQSRKQSKKPAVKERPSVAKQSRSLAPEAVAAKHSWYVLQFDGQRIGYTHSVSRRRTEQKRTAIATTDEMKMTVKRFGQELKMESLRQTEELPSGELISFVSEMRNPPHAPTRTAGRIENDRLVVETTVAGRTSSTSMPWNSQVKSPAFQDRFLRETRLRPGKSHSFKSYSPDHNDISTVRLDAGDYRQVKLLDGKYHKMLKVTVTESLRPTTPLRVYIDEGGRPAKSEVDMLGKTLSVYEVPEAEAIKEIAGGDLDIAVSTLVRVKPIRQGHSARTATYRIKTEGRDPAKFLQSGGSQQLRRIDAETVDLTVTAVPFPKEIVRQPVDPTFLQPSRFLQSDDPYVIQHARTAAGGQTNPARTAVRLERYVRDKLTAKNFSTALASAAEVAKNLEGDCTEHAVLLAAMLRAREIPSRIAVGLVYVERGAAFGGHMWTEAWIGDRWVPLDATLGRGGIGACHIKMADSSFADDAPTPISTFVPLITVLGQMQIDVVAVK